MINIGLLSNNKEKTNKFLKAVDNFEQIDSVTIFVDKNLSFYKLLSVDVMFVILDETSNLDEFIFVEIIKQFSGVPNILVVDDSNSKVRDKHFELFEGFLDYRVVNDQIVDVIGLAIRGYKVFPRKIIKS